MKEDDSEDDHDSNDDGNDPEAKARRRKDRLEQNRISARESRKRKKTMIEELQRTVITLSRDNKELNDMISSLTALGRVGLPDDIGGVVAFLCSDDAKWVNGQRIEVSGGMNL